MKRKLPSWMLDDFNSTNTRTQTINNNNKKKWAKINSNQHGEDNASLNSNEVLPARIFVNSVSQINAAANTINENINSNDNNDIDINHLNLLISLENDTVHSVENTESPPIPRESPSANDACAIKTETVDTTSLPVPLTACESTSTNNTCAIKTEPIDITTSTVPLTTTGLNGANAFAPGSSNNEARIKMEIKPDPDQVLRVAAIPVGIVNPLQAPVVIPIQAPGISTNAGTSSANTSTLRNSCNFGIKCFR